MTCWFCDRCGKQVKKDSYGAGKYGIQKTFYETNITDGFLEQRRVQRFLKFCDECAMEMEKFLDDEFNQVPSVVTAEVDKRY